LTRWAVPVFLMITGSLLLDPGRELGLARIGRYLWRISFVLLTVGFLFCLMESAAGAPGLTPSALPGLAWTSFVNLLSGDSWDHLWYLYALLVLYLLTPFIRAFVRDASRRDLRTVTLAAYVLLCAVPTINGVFDTRILSFLGLGAPVAYYLAGYYAYAYLELNRRVVAAAAAALVALVAIYAIDPSLGGPIALPEYGFALPLSLAVFLGLRRWLDVSLEGRPLVSLLARDSFGIYLFHPLFAHLAVRMPIATELPLLVVQLAIVVSGVVGSVVITRVLRLLPCFREKL
ncbi:MAG: acyltransferase family protein, partial [Olsenella sp.]|nr:acyltransferase family protein [Olsenella sp.]